MYLFSEIIEAYAKFTDAICMFLMLIGFIVVTYMLKEYDKK